MKFNVENLKAIIVVGGFLVVSVGAFAAGKKADSDAWTWQWMGSIEGNSYMFPNTTVSKFKDASSDVVCYIYSNKNATSVTFTTNGIAKEGVDGSQIGSMSCVSTRR